MSMTYYCIPITVSKFIKVKAISIKVKAISIKVKAVSIKVKVISIKVKVYFSTFCFKEF
jgi:hypothetical protein